jgi:hypothetical protein
MTHSSHSGSHQQRQPTFQSLQVLIARLQSQSQIELSERLVVEVHRGELHSADAVFGSQVQVLYGLISSREHACSPK